jgi:CubicO group peptidase (beta-lactamase class C family)
MPAGTFEAVESAVQAGEFGDTTSLVVAQRGEVIYEAYFDDLGPEALRNTRSATKTVLGILVGIAIRRGLVGGVEERVRSLVPELGNVMHPDPRKDGITIEDFLTMSSCLECDDWNPFSAGNEERLYLVEDWAGFTFDLPIRAQPGFSYCTAGVATLGIALEHALGEPLSAFARRELFDPLEITDAEWPQTPRGNTSTAGGLLLRSRDLLRLGHLYLEGGGGIVSSDWIDASTRPHAQVDEHTEYGYLWWIRRYGGRRSYFMSGLGGNRVHVVPELDAVVVITTTNFRLGGAHELSNRLVTETLATL